MILKFKKVKIENFLSFDEAEVELDYSGYTTIRGINENPVDNAKSNGAGKSTIFEAINFAICGETIRGSKEVVNIYKGGTAKVELEFTANNDNYKLIRTKDPSNLKIFINGEDKSGKGIKDSQKLLENYLPGLNSQLIGSTIILGQGLPQKFTSNSPAGRKAILEKLFETDFMIADIKERTSARKQKLSADLRAIEDSILSNTAKINLLNSQKNAAEKEISELSVINIKTIEDEVNSMACEIDDINGQVSVIDLTINNKNNLISKFNNEISSENNSFSKVLTSINDKFLNTLNDYNSKINHLNSEIYTKNAELKRLKSITDVCPTCGQKLIGVEKPDTTELESAINELNIQLSQIQLEDSQFKTSFNSEKSLADEDHRSKINEINSEINRLQAEVYSLNSEKQNLNIKVNKLYQLKNDKTNIINTLSGKIENCNNIIQNSIAECNKLSEIILYNNTEKEEINNRLSIISKIDTLNTRDFRGYLLLDIISGINSIAKKYSKIIFNTESIEFTLDGNNIIITYDGKDYDNLSGGERRKIDLIIQFAIRDCLCRNLGFSSNILALDEIFDGLDADGCDKVLNLISSQLQDVNSIFIITHHDDLSIPTDREIIVIKNKDKLSRIA